jgi:hypothetical protein
MATHPERWRCQSDLLVDGEESRSKNEPHARFLASLGLMGFHPRA